MFAKVRILSFDIVTTEILVIFQENRQLVDNLYSVVHVRAKFDVHSMTTSKATTRFLLVAVLGMSATLN